MSSPVNYSNNEYKYTQSDFNIRSLKDIALIQAYVPGSFLPLNELEKLVSLAAIKVLKNIEPYMMGTKTLSTKQIKQIENEFEKFKKNIKKKDDAKIKKFERKGNRLYAMIRQLRESAGDLNKQLDEKDLKNLLVNYYQIAATGISYCNWEKEVVIPGPHPNLADFKVHDVITNDKGLKIVVLIPTREDGVTHPILCCRGTAGDPHHFIDDINKNIGEMSFQPSRDKILDILKEVTKEHGSAIIAGHSLGGAIAQLITAEFCDYTIPSTAKRLIESTYLFSAPGVGKTIAKQYQNKIGELSENRKPYIASYYHGGDLVPLSGGDHLEANEKHEVEKFTFVGMFARKKLKEAHLWTTLISKFPNVRPVTELTETRRSVRKIAEKIRRFGAFLFKNSALNKIASKQRVEKLASILTSFMEESEENRKNKIAQHTAFENFFRPYLG